MSFLDPATPAGRSRRQGAIGRTLPNLPSPDECLRNVLETLGHATDEEWADGAAWYSVARRHADTLTPGRPAVGAGIIAALSPQLGWVPNLEAAAAAVASGGTDYGPAALSLGHDRAGRILRGEDPATVLGGRKVRSFYRNILEPDRAGPVTVDRHAVAIALGRIPTGREERILERVGAYVYVAAAYRAAGRLTGLLPHEAQAVAWLAHRRRLDESGAHGIRDNGSSDIF